MNCHQAQTGIHATVRHLYPCCAIKPRLVLTLRYGTCTHAVPSNYVFLCMKKGRPKTCYKAYEVSFPECCLNLSFIKLSQFFTPQVWDHEAIWIDNVPLVRRFRGLKFWGKRKIEYRIPFYEPPVEREASTMNNDSWLMYGKMPNLKHK